MVHSAKLSTIAALSLALATGSAASLQAPESSHSIHLHLHRSVEDKPRSFVKVQKRLANTIGGLVQGIGQDLGLSEEETSLQPQLRGLVGDILGAGGDSSSSAAPSSSEPSATSNASNSGSGSTGGSDASSAAPAKSTQASPSSGNSNASGYGNNNKGSDQATPSSSSSSGNSNSNSNNSNNSNTGSNSNSSGSSNSAAGASASANSNVQASASTVASTSSSLNATAASASALAASLLSAASAATARTSLTSSMTSTLTTQTLADGSVYTGFAPLPTSTSSLSGASQSNSSDSSGSTKVVVPIVVVTVSLALAAIAWTIYRKVRQSGQEEYYNPRMQPVGYNANGRGGGGGMARSASAFAVGGASDGFVRERRRNHSMESFEAGRPLSTLSEETGDYYNMPPPMTEVQPYGSVGGASFAAVPMAAGGSRSSRLRNYGSTRGSVRGLPVRDAEDGHGNEGYQSPFSDEHGAYDVNYYDGSATDGYNNRATKGIDAAGASRASGRAYSPYEEVQRADEEYAPSSRGRDPFSDGSQR